MPSQRNETTASAAAAHLQQQFAQRTDLHRRNPNMSDGGKQRAIAREFVNARTQMQELRAQHQQIVAAERTRLTHATFGGHADIGQFRSAVATLLAQVDAVDGTKPDARATQLQRLESALRVAQMTDDPTAAAAAFVVAKERGFNRVVDSYLQANPERARSLEELQDLDAGESDLGNRMFTPFRVMHPPELRQNEAVIQQLAAEAPAPGVPA